MRCEEVQEQLSALIDEQLNHGEREQVMLHLLHCETCFRQYEELRQFVEFCRQLESPEPRIDLWRELQPALAQIVAEQRLPLSQRLRRQWSRLVSQVCYGIILFLQVVTYQLTITLSRYIMEPERAAYGRPMRG
ncbi:MAG: zf-HC2 domain-containing protein [bacterium]|nr:zf-HC2 domain-containing protein [bacterium]MCS7310310.1 zf-HC2 domain-containing protein [Armatimonadota bacterium]MDW8104699.1 zf-HC2 domain-containing protein [Armatimonadota bacterium]